MIIFPGGNYQLPITGIAAGPPNNLWAERAGSLLPHHTAHQHRATHGHHRAGRVEASLIPVLR